MNLNSAMNGGLLFPIFGYKRTLKGIPKINDNAIESFYKARNDTAKHFNKSYKYYVEEYVLSEEIVSKPVIEDDTVFVKSLCYHSQRKNLSPHTVCVALRISNPEILDANCGCPAGVNGSCNHSVAFLKLLSKLASNNFDTPPAQLSCTDKPQKWNRPRGAKILPFSVIDINTRAPKAGGSCKPKLCNIYKATAEDKDEEKAALSMRGLIEDLNASGVDGWASILTVPEKVEWVETRIGKAIKGSPLSLQLALEEYGFDVIHNIVVFKSEMFVRCQNLPSNRFPLPIHSDVKCKPWKLIDYPNKFSNLEEAVLKRNEVSLEEAKKLEEETRNQSDCQLWKKLRETRLSSSMFGAVSKRKNQNWTDVGVRNIVKPKDIGHLNAIKYGRKFETTGRDKYIEYMRNFGHQVSVYPSGYIIDPNQPWLGTSPDGLVYDPKEECPYGLLEIKCPYSLKDKTPSEVLNMDKDFSIKIVNGKPVLSETHNHYYQILGQMALSRLEWCDYVNYFPAGLIIVRVRFNPKRWREAQPLLKGFFFTHMLPKLADEKV